MTVTYTSRNGRTYYLCLMQNKLGGNCYVLSRKIVGQAMDKIPSGYKIQEYDSGQVSLVKIRQKNRQNRNRQKPIPPQTKPPYSPKPQRNQANKYEDYPLEPCPVCSERFPFPKLKWHIQDKHRHYTPQFAISVSRAAETGKQVAPRRDNYRQLSPEEKAAKIRQEAIQINEMPCGWCTKTIYQVWHISGKHHYYEDEELTTRHKCVRPAYWDIDR